MTDDAGENTSSDQSAQREVETTGKRYEPGTEETRGWIGTSPIMPEVVEGPLEPPPLTSPTPEKHEADE